MVGDQADMLGRLKALLPARWFPGPDGTGASQSPILDGVLSGVAWMLSWEFSLLSFVKLQTRIATATDVFLDIIALDFFGPDFTRDGQSDAGFRARILASLFAQRVTRAALVARLVALTGQTPVIFEPANTTDTGGWGTPGMAAGTGFGYGVAGGWGNLDLPFQFFVTAFRPAGQGISNVAGWGNIASGAIGMPGGYSFGALEYADVSLLADQITDATILAAIVDTIPIATIAWTRIDDPEGSATGEAPGVFTLDVSLLDGPDVLDGTGSPAPVVIGSTVIGSTDVLL